MVSNERAEKVLQPNKKPKWEVSLLTLSSQVWDLKACFTFPWIPHYLLFRDMEVVTILGAKFISKMTLESLLVEGCTGSQHGATVSSALARVDLGLQSPVLSCSHTPCKLHQAKCTGGQGICQWAFSISALLNSVYNACLCATVGGCTSLCLMHVKPEDTQGPPPSCLALFPWEGYLTEPVIFWLGWWTANSSPESSCSECSLVAYMKPKSWSVWIHSSYPRLPCHP